MIFASQHGWLSEIYFTGFQYYYGELYPFLALVLKKCVYLHPKSTRVVVRCEESICIGPPFKVRQILIQRTTILMPFASAYVMVLYHCILEHRIRFKTVLLWKGVWRCLNGVELKQHEFYAFLVYIINL